MKLIFAILRDHDADPVTQALTAAGFRVTRVASTGGFLRRGTTTLLLGVDDHQVEAAITVMREKCTPSDGTEKRATVFVTSVDRFAQV
jgi:uncharacterized protein YaaQ